MQAEKGGSISVMKIVNLIDCSSSGKPTTPKMRDDLRNHSNHPLNKRSKKLDGIPVDLPTEVHHDVLEHGRETRPAAPVPRDPVVHVNKSKDVPNTMAKDDVERRRERTSVCPGSIHLADRRAGQRRNIQRRRKRGPSRKRVRRRRTSA